MFASMLKRGSLSLLVVSILLVGTTALAAPGLLADVIGQSDKTISLELVAEG